MGLLDVPVGIDTLNVLTDPLGRRPKRRPDDFTEGFIIREILPGNKARQSKGVEIVLKGNRMPVVPFSWGGTQQAVKEFYPGNPEANIQVLGPRENDLTITGRFHAKKFRNSESLPIPNPTQQTSGVDLYTLPYSIMEEIDALRRRGSLVQLILGDWQRFGLISDAKWDMRKKGDIGYSITFLIMSLTSPAIYAPVLDDNINIPVSEKNVLAASATTLANNASSTSIPTTVNLSIGQLFTTAVSSAFEAVNAFVGFFENFIALGEDLVAQRNRILGSIKNVRQTVRRNQYRLARIKASDLGSIKNFEKFRTFSKISTAVSDMNTIQVSMRDFEDKFRKIAETAPALRHRVRQGETLQTLAVKYYANADLWNKIATHNRLSDVPGVQEVTTVLVVADISSSLDGKYFELQDSGGSVVVWIDVDDSGTSPPAEAIAADRALEVTTIVADDPIGTVAQKIFDLLNTDGAFRVTLSGNTVTVTTIAFPPVSVQEYPDADAGTSGFTVTSVTKGKPPIPLTQLTPGQILEIPNL
jgi:hypothetical protein